MLYENEKRGRKKIFFKLLELPEEEAREGPGGGDKSRREKGGPAELGNQSPSNRCSSGDVFKGSFLTTG